MIGSDVELHPRRVIEAKLKADVLVDKVALERITNDFCDRNVVEVGVEGFDVLWAEWYLPSAVVRGKQMTQHLHRLQTKTKIRRNAGTRNLTKQP